MPNVPSPQIEEDRIRTVYTNRQDKGRYSYFNPAYLFMVQERERQLLGLLKKRGIDPLEGIKILEIGCGIGSWLRAFINWGAQPQNITGIDLLADRIAIARRLCPEAVRFECGSAARLEFADNSFDIVLQSTVFSSVLDPSMRQQIASEMLRVVKVNGVLLWYDFHVNNPKNPDVRGITKQKIFRLFPACQIELFRSTLFPFLARVLAPYSWLACYLLERFKVFNTNYLGVIRKV